MADLEKEALLVVDMSHDFVADDGALTAGAPAQAVVPYILEQAERFLQDGGLVVFTMDAHQPDDPHFELWPPHNVVGTQGQELYGDLKSWYEAHRAHDRVRYVPKTNYNAFFRTPLADMLRDQGIEKVHVVGVCTDICDFLTVAGADAEGFRTALHTRGCATFTENGPLFLEQSKLCFHTEIVE